MRPWQEMKREQELLQEHRDKLSKLQISNDVPEYSQRIAIIEEIDARLRAVAQEMLDYEEESKNKNIARLLRDANIFLEHGHMGVAEPKKANSVSVVEGRANPLFHAIPLKY